VSNAADIRVKTTQDFRQEFKAAATREGMTYEEFLQRLLQLYERNKGEFHNLQSEDRSHRRDR